MLINIFISGNQKTTLFEVRWKKIQLGALVEWDLAHICVLGV